MEEISDASRENELKKDLASVKESYEYIFEGLLKGKKGMIEDVSKKITLVMAKLGSLANTPGMSSEVQKLQSEVAGIAAQMGELLNKKNKEINKEDIKKADTRLTEIPTVLDKLAERMLKQDSTNKEAASILVQAFNLVQAAKEKEKVYISKKEEAEREAEAKATILYDIEKMKDVNPTVKKFQELVISKLGKNKQISSIYFHCFFICFPTLIFCSCLIFHYLITFLNSYIQCTTLYHIWRSNIQIGNYVKSRWTNKLRKPFNSITNIHTANE
jgi:hypothetical protein